MVFGCWLRHAAQVIREKRVTSYIPERKQGYKHRQLAATGRRSTGRDGALPSGLSGIKVVCCLLVQTFFFFLRLSCSACYVKEKKFQKNHKERKKGRIPAERSVTQSIWQRRRSKRPDSTVEEKSIHGAERMRLSSQIVLLKEKIKHFGWEERKRETTHRLRGSKKQFFRFQLLI